MRRLIGTLLFLFAITGAARAGEIKAIIVSDTNNIMQEAVSDISVGVRVNVAKMKTFLTRIGTVGEIAVKVTEVTGDNFTCAKINRAVADLAVAPDDTVIFYYSGHGFRGQATQGKFPEFLCDQAALVSGHSDATMAQVAADIKRKGPRLSILIADTCNKDNILPPAAAPLGAGRPPTKETIRRFFLKYKGAIMTSGAVPGQQSWYRVRGLDIGGLFTGQLLKQVNIALGKDKVLTWDDVLTSATLAIPIPGADPQQPQYESTAKLIANP